jgi:hypothetical protein
LPLGPAIHALINPTADQRRAISVLSTTFLFYLCSSIPDSLLSTGRIGSVGFDRKMVSAPHDTLYMSTFHEQIIIPSGQTQKRKRES